jgi:hypothetical protein
MNIPEDSLEDNYRRKFENFEEEPSDKLWENLLERLPEDKQRPKGLIWNFKNLAIVAGIALFTILGIIMYPTKKTSQKVLSQSKTRVVKEKNKDLKPTKETSNITNKQGAVSTSNLANIETKLNNTKKYIKHLNQNEIEKINTNNDIVIENRKSNNLWKTNERAPSIVNTAVEPNLKKDTANALIEKLQIKVSEKLSDIKIWDKTETQSDQTIQKIENKLEETPRPTIANLTTENQASEVINNEIKTIDTVNKLHFTATEESTIEETPIVTVKITPDDLEYLKSKQATILVQFPPYSIQQYYPEIKGIEMERKKLIFYKPSEIYLSVIPSLNYYQAKSTINISNFEGAASNWTNRLGVSIKTGLVYPLGKNTQIRISGGYSHAKASFSYINTNNREIKLSNENTLMVQNKTITETNTWNHLEGQVDLLMPTYKNHSIALGIKGVSSLTNDLMFKSYVGYKISKALSKKLNLWIEPSYSYLLNNKTLNFISYRTFEYAVQAGISILK